MAAKIREGTVPPANPHDPDPWCCYIPPGKDVDDEANHCEQFGSILIRDAENDKDYTHACGDHAGELRGPGDRAYNLKTGKEIPDAGQ